MPSAKPGRTGRALKDGARRDEVVIATKALAPWRSALFQAIDVTLRADENATLEAPCVPHPVAGASFPMPSSARVSVLPVMPS